MPRVCNFRQVLAGATGTLLLSALSAIAHAQEAKAIDVKPTDYDRYAASLATDIRHHARHANTKAGRSARPTELSNMHSAAAAAAAAAPDSGALRYPADLQYHGGPVVVSMRQHLIYVNVGTTCASVSTCWGNPHGFLRDLGKSDMIHITDQYVGSAASGRYTVSEEEEEGDSTVSYPLSAHPYTDLDILTIVHAVVASHHFSTGYDHEFHVFLVPGQDECFDSTYSVCYSPDNLPTYFFCAYHGSADFQDIGHVLYSVEPFQNTLGCNSRANSPNGPLIDSTNNVLSHETFETITDPDGTAWWNSDDNGLYGQEIGDECSFLYHDANGNVLAFDPSNVRLNGRAYAIQPEADNAQHGCSTTSP